MKPSTQNFLLFLLALLACLFSLLYLLTHPPVTKEVEAQTAESTHSEIKMYGVRETITAIVSSYSPWETCPGGLAKNCVDASGASPIANLTVACPRRYPLGTRVYIETIGPRTCTDRLSRRFDQRFDLFREDYKEALRFGKKRLQVFILE